MEEFSRPATLDDLKLLLQSLNEHGAETIDLDGVPVKTVNLEGLLLTKQTARDKDLADRIVIERALAVFRANTQQNDENKGKKP